MRPLIALLLLLATGCASCPYDQRCDGDTLQICTLGVDQMVGDPGYARLPCEAPNPVCVETGKRTAQCVMPEAPRCDADFAEQCQAGTLAVTCAHGYQVALDCAADDNACLVVEGRVHCALSPATACDSAAYPQSCEDDAHLLHCAGGLVARRDCGNEPRGRCEPHVPQDEYERSAYCQTPPEPDAGVSAPDAGATP